MPVAPWPPEAPPALRRKMWRPRIQRFAGCVRSVATRPDRLPRRRSDRGNAICLPPQLRSALCFTLLCPQPRRYTARHEYGEPTECEVRANPRLPRSLLQQRADPGECVGFLPRFRDHAAKLGDARGIAKLSGDLSQPAAGQGTDGALAAERGELRVRVRRDQA